MPAEVSTPPHSLAVHPLAASRLLHARSLSSRFRQCLALSCPSLPSLAPTQRSFSTTRSARCFARVAPHCVVAVAAHSRLFSGCMPFPTSCVTLRACSHTPYFCFLPAVIASMLRVYYIALLSYRTWARHAPALAFAAPCSAPAFPFFAAIHPPPSFLTPTLRVSPSLLKPSRRSSRPLVSLMSRLSGPASSPRPPPALTSRVSCPASAPVLALPPLPLPPPLPPPLQARPPPPPRPRRPSLSPKRRRLAASACSTRAAGQVVMRRAQA